MSDNPTQDNTQPQRGRGGRGGRGGGRGKVSSLAVRTGGSVATRSKIGPIRKLEADWAEESSLKGKTFAVWVGSGEAGSRQYTFHPPIGHTELKGSQWVATPTDEVHYLLEARTSEAIARWEREMAFAQRAIVLAAGTGRKLISADPHLEGWSFDGAPPIAATIKIAQAAAKAAGKPDSEWVNHTEPAVRAAELQFKEALRKAKLPVTWYEEHPRPKYETKGGPARDRPQLAIGYLDNLSLGAAKDAVLSRMLGLTPKVEVRDQKKLT